MIAQTPGCKPCRLLAKSSEYFPARLPLRALWPPPLRPLLHGAWASPRCETRPYGQFLTRALRFSGDNETYEGREDHFSDALCQRGTYSLRTRGGYRVGGEGAASHAIDFIVRLKFEAFYWRRDDAGLGVSDSTDIHISTVSFAFHFI